MPLARKKIASTAARLTSFREQWVTYSTKSKALAWTVVQNLDEKTSRDRETTKVPDWGSHTVADICDEVRHLPIPNGPPGSTLGTLIDQTHKSLISKACFNEKVFKTWFSGRVVLLGDGKDIDNSPVDRTLTRCLIKDCLSLFANSLP